MNTVVTKTGACKKAVILLNGEPYRGKIDAEGARVFCCDGAYEWAKCKVKIDENLGDFDSLPYTPDPPPVQVYPSEKDDTDGELALDRAFAYGAKEILIYGGGGGREDHFIGNLHLLYAASLRGVSAQMVTNHARIFLHSAQGSVVLKGLKGKTVSIIPFGGDAHIIKSGGLKYPLNDLSLVYGSTRGISNVATEDEAYFRLSSGKVLVFVNEEIQEE